MWRVLLFMTLVAGVAKASEESWRLERMSERYEDFFKRLKDIESYNDHREAGAEEVVKERRAWVQKMETARQDYVNNKKAPPDQTAAHNAWLAEQEKWHKDHETGREQYVEVKNHVELIQRSSKRIPEDVEYDIEP